MRERLHLLLREPTPLPVLHPWPSLDICDTVLAFAVASEVVARLASVLAGELDLEDTKYTQSLIAEALNSVWDLLLSRPG